MSDNPSAGPSRPADYSPPSKSRTTKSPPPTKRRRTSSTSPSPARRVAPFRPAERLQDVSSAGISLRPTIADLIHPTEGEAEGSRHAQERRRRSASEPVEMPGRAAASEHASGSGSEGGRTGDWSSDGGEGLPRLTPHSYRLEVIQHPQRARACGFGDKDRRPLSPPPIVRLWVYKPDGTLADVNDVEIHLLVLIVDLWSADQQQPCNIVVHPSSQSSRQESPARSVSILPELPVFLGHGYRPGSSSSRPSTGMSVGSTDWPAQPYRFSVTSATGQTHSDPQGHGLSPTRRMSVGESQASHGPSRISGWPPPDAEAGTRPGLGRSLSQLGASENRRLELPRPVTAPSSSPTPSPMQPLPPQQGRTNLRPLSSSGRPSSSHDVFRHRRDSWGYSSTLPPLEYPGGRPSTSSSAFYTDRPGTADQPLPRTPSETYYPQLPHEPVFASEEAYEEYNRPRSPATYSRVLVGSLSTICQRLQGPEGKAGLFFFAHDLGVRTEGQFTLRFALSSLDSFMGQRPRPGQHVPMLAETFSDPFTVYSAKRFPGVIPTTNLTRLFANQNVRLPTRQARVQSDANPASDDD